MTKKKVAKTKKELEDLQEAIKESAILGRIIANTYYDFQEIRISAMNKIRDVIRKKVEGIKFDEVEGKKSKKEKDIGKYTDENLLVLWDYALNSGKITKEEYKYTKKCWDLILESVKFEGKAKRLMMAYVKSEPVYNEFLLKVRGIGTVLSANLLKAFGDCSRYDTVSKLWAHCGQSVINGRAPKKKVGEVVTYSPKLRTLVWNISDCLMKCNKGYYRQIYDTEKEKQLGRDYEKGFLKEKFKAPYKEEETKLRLLHAHNRALRKMRKLFLSHYWSASRELNGLSTDRTYVEGVLAHKNIVTWKKALSMEQST